MKRIAIGALMLSFCLASGARAGEAEKEKPKEKPKETWQDKISKALDAELKDINWTGQPVGDVLKAFSKSAGVTVVFDPKAAEAVKDVKIDLVAKSMTARNVLGNILKLAGGLRYTLANEAIYVSTASSIANKLLAPVAEAEPRESRAMTTGEAAAMRMNREAASEGVVALGIVGPEFYGSYQAPRTRADGITDFAGPSSVILRSEDYGDRRFWFTSTPFFVKPEYRGIVPQSLSDAVRTEVKDDTAEKIVAILKANPNLTGAELLARIQSAR